MKLYIFFFKNSKFSRRTTPPPPHPHPKKTTNKKQTKKHTEDIYDNCLQDFHKDCLICAPLVKRSPASGQRIGPIASSLFICQSNRKEKKYIVQNANDIRNERRLFKFCSMRESFVM